MNEEVNPHDIEYPDIPSIPEEQEEEQDQPSPLSNSPVNFPEFSPETELVKPWKGILKKSSSVNVNSSMYWDFDICEWFNIMLHLEYWLRLNEISYYSIKFL